MIKEYASIVKELLETRKNIKGYLIVITLISLSAFLEVLSIYLFSKLLEFYTTNESNLWGYIGDLFNLNITRFQTALIQLLLIIISFTVRSMALYKMYTFSHKIEEELSWKLYNKLYHKSISWIDVFGDSKIQNSFTQEIQLSITHILIPSIYIISHLITGLLYIITTIIYSPIIAFVSTFLISALYFLIIKKVNVITVSLGKSRVLANEERLSSINEFLLNAKYLRFVKNKEIFKQKFKNVLEEIYEISWKFNFISQLPRILVENILFILVTIGLIIMLSNGDSIFSNIASISFIGIAFIKIIPVFQNVYVIMNQFKFGLPAFNLIQGILLDEKTTFFSDKKVSANLIEEGRIEIKNLSFTYPTKKNIEIFNKLSLKIIPKRLNVITAPSGYGKSTILDLILNFYEPNNGKIIIDNSDIKNISKEEFYSKVGYIPQNVTLFNTTLYDNISLGEDYPLDLVIQTLKKVELYDLIKDSKNILDFNIGLNGDKISGGQRQRLAIARALIREPKILVCDEPTSALDITNEGIITSLLSKISQEITVILVTHRTDSIKSNFNHIELDKL